MTHPTRDSIFGDTYHGVPSPLVPHVHPYPTRFHGPIWTMPQATFPYVETPYARVPFSGVETAGRDLGVGACCDSCEHGGACEGGASGLGDDDRPPLLSSVTGSTVGDAIVGAAVGYMVASKPSDRLKSAAVGGVSTALLGTLGLVLSVAGPFLYKRGFERGSR